MGRADAHVRLDNDRISDFRDKSLSGFPAGYHMLPGCRDPCFQVQLLHQAFFLDETDSVGTDARGNVEIRPQPCVLLQPVFIHGLDPIDLSVFPGKERDRPVHLVIILQAVYPVILRQCGFQRGLQAVVRRVADSQYIDPVPAQPVAELPVGMGKMRRNKYKVHIRSTFILQSFSAGNTASV